MSTVKANRPFPTDREDKESGVFTITLCRLTRAFRSIRAPGPCAMPATALISSQPPMIRSARLFFIADNCSVLYYPVAEDLSRRPWHSAAHPPHWYAYD